MNLDVKIVKPLQHYKIYVEIENGARGLFDLKPYLDKGVFTQLKNTDYFNQVGIMYGAVTWVNGQDIEPSTLVDGLEKLKITNVIATDDYKLTVEFNNDILKKYDVSQLFHLDAFKPLQDKFLFKQVKVDITGYGIIWNDEIDISENEIWNNGTNE